MSVLSIDDWAAWAPGLADAEAWRDWCAAPRRLQENGEQPDASFLAPMQRRRLSRLARICMQVAWPLCGEHEQLPLVFCSRHGETTRTYNLLGEVDAGQPLSPTQFGLSVHNAIAGQWSILRGQRAESVALAGERDGFEHAMLEAALLLAAGAPAVVVLLAEEKPPPAYQAWIDDVPFSYALGLRVSAATTTAPRWRLQLHAADAEGGAIAPWPHALNFLRALLDPQTASLRHHWRSRAWLWQRQT